MVYRSKLIICLLIMLFLYACSGKADKHKTNKSADCLISSGLCSKKLGNIELELDITPKPVLSMKELNFRVTLKKADKIYKKLILDLNMPAMDMGLNRVTLNSESKNVYSGKGTIVKCKSGHTLWEATITIPGIGDSKFYFDVENAK